MSNGRFAAWMLTAGLLMAWNAAFAHHGATMYDTEHLTTFKGTVTEFEFVNPHAVIHLEVKEANGSVERWTAEIAPPAMLRRIGWNKDTIKPGEVVTISCYKAKDGSKVASVRKIVLANGQELNQRIN